MTRLIINGILGKMGKEITKALTNHENLKLVGGIDKTETTLDGGISVLTFLDDVLQKADLVIDFSLPEGTEKIVNACQKFTKPLVTGTTGLTVDQQNAIMNLSNFVDEQEFDNFDKIVQ